MKTVIRGEDKVGNFGKVVCVFLLLFFAVLKSPGQSNVPQTDSLRIRQEVNRSTDNRDRQNGNAFGKNNQGSNAQGQAVKRIRAGRPDMSRARGARPPMIVRPSGSGIPKGIGKPGGVGRRGGR